MEFNAFVFRIEIKAYIVKVGFSLKIIIYQIHADDLKKSLLWFDYRLIYNLGFHSLRNMIRDTLQQNCLMKNQFFDCQCLLQQELCLWNVDLGEFGNSTLLLFRSSHKCKSCSKLGVTEDKYAIPPQELSASHQKVNIAFKVLVLFSRVLTRILDCQLISQKGSAFS